MDSECPPEVFSGGFGNYKVFEITRLTKLLKIVPTEKEAFAVFGVGP